VVILLTPLAGLRLPLYVVVGQCVKSRHLTVDLYGTGSKRLEVNVGDVSLSTSQARILLHSCVSGTNIGASFVRRSHTHGLQDKLIHLLSLTMRTSGADRTLQASAPDQKAKACFARSE